MANRELIFKRLFTATQIRVAFLFLRLERLLAQVQHLMSLFDPEEEMEDSISTVEILKRELILRIYRRERDKLLTKREQRALDAWFRAKAGSRPEGKAWAAARKMAREFSEFEDVLAGKRD